MIVLITGDFCTGKDTVANIMCYLAPDCTHKILSYTTRAPRDEDDLQNHEFCTDEEFDHWTDWIATTEIEGIRYGARLSQFTDDNNILNLYVVDGKGVNDVLDLEKFIDHDIVVVEVVRPVWLRKCPKARQNRKKAPHEAFPVDYRLFNDGDEEKLTLSCRECLSYINTLRKPSRRHGVT